MNEERKSIYELLEEDIMSSDYSLREKNERLSLLIKARSKKVNILFAGATGSGKSSTINALFGVETAKVGEGVDPETDKIASYELENLVIWDTPGFGDSEKNDRRYNRMLVEKLSETGEDGRPLIDLVLVIIDASTKDLRTTCDLISKVIVPCLGDEAKSRILIGLNQADMAMKGNHWYAESNVPDEVLLEFLKKKCESVSRRIQADTGLCLAPVFYCAGYKEENGEQRKPYNLTKLLYYIVSAIPVEKRLALADHINDDEDMWQYDDEEEDYVGKTKRSFLETIGTRMRRGFFEGVYEGDDLLGFPGKVVGGIIGGVCGTMKGFWDAIFG